MLTTLEPVILKVIFKITYLFQLTSTSLLINDIKNTGDHCTENLNDKILQQFHFLSKTLLLIFIKDSVVDFIKDIAT